MKALFNIALAAFALSLAFQAQAAGKHDYTYTPAAGVHEKKHFHGCYDNADIDKRPKVHVTMQGLATSDVTVETRPLENGKPSSEMITFRLKNGDASFSVQFRSNDGPHCQQGVQSIAFTDKVLHSAAQVNAMR